MELPELIASRRARVARSAWVTLVGGIDPASTDHDPHVPRTHKMRRHDLGLSVSLEILQRYDCVIIKTHHDGDDARLIVDTRNALAGVKGDRGHIVRA
jgi:hypothetical protein